MTFNGLYVPLVTPFEPSGAVALDALEDLAHRMLADGAHGLVALGTTGEPGSLTEPERRAVVEVIGRVCRERSAQLIVGAGTAEALRGLAGHPAVTAALIVVPPFVRPGEDGALAHLAHLAELSPVPLIVYDIPHRTGQYLSAGALHRLAEIPGIAGLKYAPGEINADTVALLADPPPRFAVLGGDDPYLSPLLAMGAHGGIVASALVAPAAFTALLAAWQAGDVAGARALGHRLARLSLGLFAGPNPTVIKAVLHAQGRIPTPDVRLPLLAAGPAERAAALALLPDGALTAAGVHG
jgi:4-hydroxy-tetrahydrodipicolinate synthase